MKIRDLTVLVREAFRGQRAIAAAALRMQKNLSNPPRIVAGPLAVWNQRIAEHVNARIDAQKAEMQVRVLCKDENDFHYVTATIPASGPSRVYALRQVAKLLVAGVSPEHTRGSWRAADLVLLARSMGRVEEAATSATEAMQALQAAHRIYAAKTGDGPNHRGRNKRFAKRRPWGQA